MGRELKRVPIDFEWEINKLWCGYINPHKIHECKECNGSGNSKEFIKLLDEWYGNHTEVNYKPNPFKNGFRYNTNAWKNNITEEDVTALFNANRLSYFTRVPINQEQIEIVKEKIANGENYWISFNNGYIPTPQEVNEWNLKGFGHDSINAIVCVQARLKREGKPDKCSKCNGTGENWQHPIAKNLYKNWKSYDPPTGEGFQLWNTTTEGYPMTPVFNSLEELCQYCEKEKISVYGKKTANKEEWFKMLNNGFVYYNENNTIFL